jgi:hypothetical protein
MRASDQVGAVHKEIGICGAALDVRFETQIRWKDLSAFVAGFADSAVLL